jgi:L-amino acid N-acyltransferase YncA
MEIIEETGKINFSMIVDLLQEEWPKEWGKLSKKELIREFEITSAPKFDVNKYLYENDKIIGWYRYSAWPREENNKSDAHILDIVLNSNYQGKGLGKLLMEDLIKDCRKKGFEKLMSRTIEGNFQSYKLHERNSFKIAFIKGIDIVWELSLAL